MSDFPQWDALVEWGPPLIFAVDRATGRRAYRGPGGEPGTPDPYAADGAWGGGNYGVWDQPDGTTVYYPPAAGIHEALLASIGAPLGLVNLEALTLWANSEGMPADAWNPCATLRTGYGEHYVVPYTAPFYPSMVAGVRAWRDTLNSGGHNYGAIVTAFRDQLGLGGIYDQINQSAWCGGCQGGHYPVQLYNQAVAAGGGSGLSGGPGVPPPSGPPPGPGPTPAGDPAEAANVHTSWQELSDTITQQVPARVAELVNLANNQPRE